MMSYLPEGYLWKTAENQKSLSSLESFKEAYINGTVLEARATLCDRDHNLHVDLGFLEGVIWKDECAVGIREGTVRDIAIIARVGKPVQFIVTDIVKAGDRQMAYLSRRAVQEDFLENRLPELRHGDVLDVRVTHLESFGAFCDIGCGINALLPIDHISVSRIPHPGVRFKTGEDIRAIIKEVDPNGRITLSHKELLGTWEENAALFRVGETVGGIVRSVEPYGIFVELMPNLAGLAEYTDSVSVGQHASVFIKSILPEKMKCKLIIVDAFDENLPPEKPLYFFDGDHIGSFRYSPPGAVRVIESNFDL